jgi:hypothetical protein
LFHVLDRRRDFSPEHDFRLLNAACLAIDLMDVMSYAAPEVLVEPGDVLCSAQKSGCQRTGEGMLVKRIEPSAMISR